MAAALEWRRGDHVVVALQDAHLVVRKVTEDVLLSQRPPAELLLAALQGERK
jgi:ParB/RepB/Spo0J family partition protein